MAVIAELVVKVTPLPKGESSLQVAFRSLQELRFGSSEIGEPLEVGRPNMPAQMSHVLLEKQVILSVARPASNGLTFCQFQCVGRH